MLPIVTCTVTGKCLPVLETSVRTYCPGADFLVYKTGAPTGGESLDIAFKDSFEKYDEIIFASDDVVFTPYTYDFLLEDVENLKKIHGELLGAVGAKSDCARDTQNIKFTEKDLILKVNSVSPILMWLSKKAYEKVNFPHFEWFSDDLFCMDLMNAGFTHYVSRSYVHHVGSQTIGDNSYRMYLESIKWMEENRPDVVNFFKR